MKWERGCGSGQMHLCRYMYEVMHPLQFMRPCRPFQGPTLLTVHNTIPISQREREKGCCSMLASHAEFDNNRPRDKKNKIKR